MNAPDQTSDLLTAILAADQRHKTAALRLLRGESAQQPPRGPIFVTGAGAARLLGVGRTTFRRWAAMAGIKPVEVFPKCFRYRRADVESIAARAGAAS